MAKATSEVKTRAKLATQAIEWIALNDAPGDNEDVEQLAGYISVVMAADVFGVPAERIAQGVYDYRRAMEVIENPDSV